MYSVALILAPLILILVTLVLFSRASEDDTFELALSMLERRIDAHNLDPRVEYRVVALQHRAKRFLRLCVVLTCLGLVLAYGCFAIEHLIASLTAGFLFVFSLQFLLEASAEYTSRSKRVEHLRTAIREKQLISYESEA
jgi:hypothetical protein